MTVSYFDGANKLKQEGRLEEAIASYRSAIEENPNFYWSYPNLGDVLLKVSRWEEAVNAYSRAIELNPSSSAWIYYNQGEALTKLGRLDEAIVSYQRAIDLSPDDREIQSSFAEALRQRSQVDLDRAIGIYQRAIELNPESVEAYKNLLKLQPDNWEVWWQWGNVLAKQNHWEEAIAAYKRVIELNPDVLEAYRKLTELQPDNWEFWLQLGNIYSEEDRKEESIAAYKQVLKLSPSCVAASQQLRRLQPESWEGWLNLDHLSQIERYRALALAVEYVAGTDVEGDIAEFGTMFGNTAKFLAFALSRTDSHPTITLKLSQMKLHLFDSFQGLPYSESEPDQESPHVKTGVWGPGTCKGSTKEQVLEICKQYLPESRIMIYEGWFQDTLPQIPTKTKFSMIHIDSDLYQSAIEVLDTCFAREFVQEGTVIFFDDWNCNRASPKFGERKAWQEIQEKYSINFSDWGIYGTGGYRIIVHSYNIPNNNS